MSKYVSLKNLFFLVSVGFIAIQFVQPDRDKPTPIESGEIFAVLEADSETQEIIKSSCFDCHSYNTNYPWYSHVAPVSWWIQDHINHGISELNFSIWDSYNAEKASHKLEECFEQVAKGNMPLNSYTWGHKEARLTEAQRAKLAGWFKLSKRKIEGKIQSDK